MSIANVFLSGTQKKNRGHFANIVRIAKSTGKIYRSELRLLKKIKKDLNINDLAYRKILRNPDLYPMVPPADYDARIERLHALVDMLLIDKDSYDVSVKLLNKLAIGIGFTIGKHEEVVERAIELVKAGVDMDTFNAEIKKVNSTK